MSLGMVIDQEPFQIWLLLMLKKNYFENRNIFFLNETTKIKKCVKVSHLFIYFL